jgi:hypothetical protein
LYYSEATLNDHLLIVYSRILGMMFGRPPMVVWTSSDPVIDASNDELLSMEPYSARKPVPETQVSAVSFFAHSMRYSQILLDILK